MDGATDDQMRDFVATQIPPHMHNDIPKDSAGLKAEVAKRLVNCWADASFDHNVTAIAVQYTVEKELGLDKTYSRPLGAKEADKVHNFLLKHEPVLSSFVRATYANTQETLRKAGITHMEVCRGFNDDYHSRGEVDVALQPLSSFTTDHRTAMSFSARDADSFSNPRIAYGRVPRERIFSTAFTGPGCLTESEVIVLGGTYRMRVEKPVP
jgi:hypothetical protein